MTRRVITPEQMAKAKEDAAELLRLRQAATPAAPTPGGADVDPRVLQVIDDAVGNPEPETIHALVLALVQFGWMTADFLTVKAAGHPLNASELDRLLALFQSDTTA